MNLSSFPVITEEDKKLPLYMTSVGAWENQHPAIRPEGFPGFHWHHTVKGKGYLLLEGKEYTLTEGMGFFICAGVPHEYYSINEPWGIRWVTFDGFAAASILEFAGLNKSKVFYISDTDIFNKLILDIYNASHLSSSIKTKETSNALYRFLMEAKTGINTSSSNIKNSKHKQLEPVIQYIENNYKENPSIDEMAAVINITPQHLCRLFKQVYSTRPFVYLNKVRIQKAKKMILDNNLSINEIAQSVGFNVTSYFCSTFKELEGITPTEFRQLYRG